MFAQKVFELYGFQQQIQKLGVNRIFSRMANREIGGEAVSALDNLFYMISTSRVTYPEALTELLKYERNDPGLDMLKRNINWLHRAAQRVIAETPEPEF